MTSPIESARIRLAAALLAGEDTATHRQAIARLEAHTRASEDRRDADAMATQKDHDAAIQERADVIAADAQAQVDAILGQHPVPALVDEHHG